MFPKPSRASFLNLILTASVSAMLAVNALAATETVLHSFGPAGRDGQKPFAGLTQHNGTFYGTTDGGGPSLMGSVFAMKLVNGVWKEKMLYAFSGHEDGGLPQSPVTFDATGNLYGTTHSGGAPGFQNGVVFQLSQVNGAWKETVLYRFLGLAQGGQDGFAPGGGVLLDSAGNLYGVTGLGGANKGGTVYKLSQTNGVWSETILYNFSNGVDGSVPIGELIFDTGGNLYGCTSGGGVNSSGTVFKLTPNPDGSWSKTVLHSFGSDASDGVGPSTGLTADAAGNLYGTTTYGGGTPNNGHGTVFQLTSTNGVWSESVLSNFTASGVGHHPTSPVLVDSSGRLFGVAEGGSGNNGVVYELSFTNGVWTHTPYYTFPDDQSGVHPAGKLLLDSAGNLYGTTVSGGTGSNVGIVYMLAP